MTRMLQWAAVLCIALGVASCGKPGVDAKRIEAAAAGDWLTHGRTYDEQRFSPLDQVNKDSVSRLGVAWWTEFDTDRGQEATPLIADGVLYTTTTWSKVFAFDAATGKPLWSNDPEVPGKLDWRFHMTPHPTGAPDGAASDKAIKGFAYATWHDEARKPAPPAKARMTHGT